MKKQQTEYLKKEKAEREWLLINAEDNTLGRLASEISKQLMGKNSIQYTPSVDAGDFIIVYNAEKIKVTGNKLKDKKYYKHSGYPGGLKETNLKTMLEKKPEYVLYNAIKGMLPKNKLGAKMLTKVKIFKGEQHTHISQNPKQIEFVNAKRGV